MAPVTFDKFYNVIDGKLVSTTNTRHGINPARIEELPPVPVSTKQDVDAVVDAAKRAAPAWAATPIEERKRLLVQLADALSSQQDEFAKMLTLEQGKPVCQGFNYLPSGFSCTKPFLAVRRGGRGLAGCGSVERHFAA